MNTKEEMALRRTLWESLEGCTCKHVYKGKSVPPEDRCNIRVARCAGRIERWRKNLKNAGLKLMSAVPTATK